MKRLVILSAILVSAANISFGQIKCNSSFSVTDLSHIPEGDECREACRKYANQYCLVQYQNSPEGSQGFVLNEGDHTKLLAKSKEILLKHENNVKEKNCNCFTKEQDDAKTSPDKK